MPRKSSSEAARGATAPPRRNPPGWRWSTDQALFFIDELCIATRDGKLNSTKESIKRGVWDTLEVVFREQWPDAVWDAKVFEGKLRQIRDFWRVFREILESSGTSYNPDTGKVSVSRQNEKMFIERYGTKAKQAFQNGLLIGNGIGIEAYEEIFSNDPRAGTQITEAHEDVGIVLASQEISPAPVVSTRDTRDDEGGDSFDEEDPYETPLPVDEDVIVIDEEEEEEEGMMTSTPASRRIPSTPAARAIRSSASSARSSSSASAARSSSSTPSARGRSTSRASYRVTEVPPNRSIPSRPRGKQGDANISLSSQDLVTAFSRLAERDNRLPGAGDVERALLDCQELLQEIGDEDPDLLGQIAVWFSGSPMRAVTWNALRSVNAKKKILEREFNMYVDDES